MKLILTSTIFFLTFSVVGMADITFKSCQTIQEIDSHLSHDFYPGKLPLTPCIHTVKKDTEFYRPDSLPLGTQIAFFSLPLSQFEVEGACSTLPKYREWNVPDLTYQTNSGLEWQFSLQTVIGYFFHDNSQKWSKEEYRFWGPGGRYSPSENRTLHPMLSTKAGLHEVRVRLPEAAFIPTAGHDRYFVICVRRP